MENELKTLKRKIKLLESKNKQLKALAFFDTLTKAYSRTWFKHNISSDSKVFLVLVDLNNLKTINDSQGHQEGDKYLLKTVTLLKKFGKTIRYGGDEFIVLCKNQTFYENLINLKTADFSKGGVTPSEYNTIAEAIILADKRLYRDKNKSK